MKAVVVSLIILVALVIAVPFAAGVSWLLATAFNLSPGPFFFPVLAFSFIMLTYGVTKITERLKQ